VKCFDKCQVQRDLYVSDGAGSSPRCGIGEAASVEDCLGEFEVQALPAHRSVFLEVCGGDSDDGVADFAAGLEGRLLRCRTIFAWIRLIGIGR
jgi:hypothetical protein